MGQIINVSITNLIIMDYWVEMYFRYSDHVVFWINIKEKAYFTNFSIIYRCNDVFLHQYPISVRFHLIPYSSIFADIWLFFITFTSLLWIELTNFYQKCFNRCLCRNRSKLTCKTLNTDLFAFAVKKNNSTFLHDQKETIPDLF